MTADVHHTEEEIAEVNGIHIAYDTFGKENDPVVLLIIGIGTQMVIWDEAFCSMLAAKGFRVVRFDNRDMGRSTVLEEAGAVDLIALENAVQKGESYPIPYTLEDMAEDAVGLLDHLGVDEAHVVGASMGGMIGQIMSARFPDRVRTFTSIMSTTGDPKLPPPRPDALMALLQRIPSDRQGYIDGWKNLWRVMSGPDYPIGDELAEKWAVLSYERGINEDGYSRQMAAVRTSGDRTKLLKTISVPTLIIHGDSDPLLPVEHGKAQTDAIPDAVLVVVKGMGHAKSRALWPRLVDEIARHALM
jgi:pimeloyl-ACP methyl ester carboxylesterase